MKIREWEIRERLQEVIGEYDDAFDRLDPGGILYVWVVKPGFRIYQFGEKISIGGSVINTDYFSPNLAKITQSSLELAHRMLEDSDDDEGTTNPYVVKRLFS